MQEIEKEKEMENLKCEYCSNDASTTLTAITGEVIVDNICSVHAVSLRANFMRNGYDVTFKRKKLERTLPPKDIIEKVLKTTSS